MNRSSDLRQLTLSVRATWDDRVFDALRTSIRRLGCDGLPDLAFRHRVSGLAWEGLCRAGIDADRGRASMLRDKAMAAAERSLRARPNIAAIVGAFEAAGIRMGIVKGFPLAAQSYDRPELKDSCDIDLLIDPGDLEKAATAFDRLGYRLSEPCKPAALAAWHARRKESVWVSAKHDQQVDLHTALVDNPRLLRGVGMASLKPVPVGGQAPVHTLTGESLYAYLCVHGASSAWFRLKWLADLAALLARQKLDASTVHAFAQSCGAGHASGQALILLNRHFDVELPSDLVTALQRSRGIRWLAGIAERQLGEDIEPTKRIGGTLPIRGSQLLLGGTLRFACEEASRQLTERVGRAFVNR